MNSDTFPIRILSGKTGVPSATIRAWERRYNILPAHRTASGHRYYNDDDALYVQQLLARMEQGKTISKAIREVDAWLAQGQVLKARVESTHNQQWQHIIDAMLEAVSQFDSFALDQVNAGNNARQGLPKSISLVSIYVIKWGLDCIIR